MFLYLEMCHNHIPRLQGISNNKIILNFLTGFLLTLRIFCGVCKCKDFIYLFVFVIQPSNKTISNNVDDYGDKFGTV